MVGVWDEGTGKWIGKEKREWVMGRVKGEYI